MIGRSAPLGGETPEWRYLRGNRDGTLRVAGVGDLTGDPTHRPTLLAEVPGVETSVVSNANVFFDVDPTDAAPEIVLVHRGSLLAIDPETGTELWRTPERLLTYMLGPFDLDGDGDAAEIVAGSGSPGGGIYAVSARTGGMFVLSADLHEDSGVYGSETVVLDLDGVPGAEVFHDISLIGGQTMYLVGSGSGLASPTRLSAPFDGFDNFHEMVGGRFRPGDAGGGVPIFLNQSIGYMWACGPADPGAVCSGFSDLCVCGPAYYGGQAGGGFDPSIEIWDTYALGYQEARDVDDDPEDELLVVAGGTSYDTSVTLIDFSDADPAGSDDGGQVVRWQILYGPCGSSADVLAPARALVDLDGDGALEALVSVYGDDGCSTDREGTAGAGGVHPADQWTALVLDPLTGAPLGTAPAADGEGLYAVGTHDFDGDGRPEVVSRVYDGTVGLDETRAFEWGCDGGGVCAFEAAWSFVGAYPFTHSTPRKDSRRIDRGVTRSFPVADLDGDGDPDLVVADSSRFGVLDPIAGTAWAWRDRPDCTNLADLHAAGAASRLLLTGTTCMEVVDGGLSPAPEAFALPPQKTPTVLLFAPEAGLPAALLANRAFYLDPAAPSPDHEFEGTPALATDLDADGFAEVVHWDRDETETWFRVHLDEWDPSDSDGDGTPFARRWTFDSAADATLDLYQTVLGNLFIEGDFDGAGEADLAFVAIYSQSTGDMTLLVLDGATGTESWRAAGSLGSSMNAGLTLGALDVGSAAGYGVLDGFEDVIYTTNYHLNVYTMGLQTRLASYSPSGTIWGTEVLYADLDGDADKDQVMVRNIDSTLNSLRAHDFFTPIHDLWEEVDPGPRSLGYLATAAVAVDGGPGLDVVFAGGDGTLGAWNGADGVALPGFPVLLQSGTEPAEVSADARSLKALAVADVDGDGHEEVLAGGDDGWVYAVDVAQAEVGTDPAVAWAYYVGSAVRSVRAADVDGDGRIEVVTGSEDGSVRFIDASQGSVVILEPEEGACLGEPDVTVSGTASAVDEVCVSLGGSVVGCSDASTGSWSVPVVLPGPGTYDLVATGRVSGVDVASDVVTVIYAPDADGDGFLACGGDCNDSDPTIHPGAPALCDGLDNDCDEEIEVEVSDDLDLDGFRVCDGDCDDADPAVHPGAEEVCNGADDDCDGAVDDLPDADGDGFTPCDGDCDDADPAAWPGADEVCDGTLDNDCDGLGDPSEVDDDGDGFTECGGDCDDSDPMASPGAVEACDGVDNDCDGAIDEEADHDGDGFTPCGGDCDDGAPTVYPGAPEVCDGVPDNDCDGVSDPAEADGDGDGVPACAGDCRPEDGQVAPGLVEVCDGIDQDCDGTVDEGTGCYDDDGDGLTEVGGDCDDADATVRPGGIEVCDGVDQDCDATFDEGTACFDDDGDGVTEDGGDCNDGDPAVHPGAIEVDNGVDDDCDGVVDAGGGDADGDGVAVPGGDCDDTDAAVWPGAPELPDGVDNDCDGTVDEGTSRFDDDGDGASEQGGDCDDGDPEVHPGAEEVPNGLDDDCDGAIDEGTDRSDDDGDGFSELGGDCDDADESAWPGAEELPNGVDDDCDGTVDETTDGYDDDEDGSAEADGDCDDLDPAAHPGGVEVADGVDNDCDGEVDEGLDPRGSDKVEACSGCEAGARPGSGGGVVGLGLLILAGSRRRGTRPGTAAHAVGLAAVALAALAVGCTGSAVGKAEGTVNASRDRLDFGTVATGSAVVDEVWVHNEGQGTLTLAGAAVEGGEGAFTTPFEAGSVLYPLGDAVPIEVTYEPSEAGDHAAELVVTVEESEESFRITLVGYARDPRLAMFPPAVDLGLVPPGDLRAATFTVVNDGVVSVDLLGGIGLEEGTAAFGLAGASEVQAIPLPVGGSVEVVVTVEAVDGSPSSAFVAVGDDRAGQELFVWAEIVLNDCGGAAAAYDLDGDGVSACAGDCDDTDASVRPAGVEVCDGSDDDCDGLEDEDTECSDDDGDGFTEGVGDCHDADPSVHPGAAEVGNGRDDDCDGVVDDGFGSVDGDGDGYAASGGDCDDGDAATFPGAPELADGVDNDCDGWVDEGTVNFDDDGDGFTEAGGDCNDALVDMSPAGVEVPDGRDNDCDGTVDEGTDWHDDDGDGTTEAGGDPDDTDPAVP